MTAIRFLATAFAVCASGCAVFSGGGEEGEFAKPDAQKYENAMSEARDGRTLHGKKTSRPAVPAPGGAPEMSGDGRTEADLAAEVARLKERIGFLEVQVAMNAAAAGGAAAQTKPTTPVVPAATTPRLVRQAQSRPAPASQGGAVVSTTSLFHGVHLASYRLPDNARAGLRELQSTFSTLIGGLDARVEAVDVADKGRFLRLKVGPFESAAAAEATCRRLKSEGAYCTATDFSGEPL
ncbi:MAG: SPOR domain-containing protein [Pseudomonadota bacterium]